VARRRRKNSRSSRRSSRSSVRVVRVTRTKGSGADQTTSYRTGGLSKRDIKLYLDGAEKTRFHYDRASGRLSYHVGGALSSGTHRVEIEAEAESGDSQGQFNSTARREWTFMVAR